MSRIPAPGRLRALARIALLLALVPVAFPARSDEAASAPASAATPVRILALGDSYTIGEGVPASERWPAQLAAALGERGLPAAEPRIVARTGWTTAQLAAAVERAELEPPYALVTLSIGVNDQVRGFALDTYPERFQALLARAIELAGGESRRVLIVSIPDYGVTALGQRLGSERIARELEELNRQAREQAERAGVAYVDVTPISREAAGDAALLAADGLHPSGAMYARWVEEILPLAERALEGDTAPAP